MAKVSFLKNLNHWIRDYSVAGVPDQRSIENFIECESAESVSSLCNELRAVASGNFEDSELDQTLGMNRKFRHGSYQDWAKMMLLWSANYKH